jgi:RNA polymerase sigma-70 factor (ECF subfamily)
MDRASFTGLLAELRPSLHRYCARMTGSVIDGEDVVQTALERALEAFDRDRPVENPAGWVFRVAHNATLDFLRRRARERVHAGSEEGFPMTEQGPSADSRVALAASLRTFLRLPVSQRSSVLLMDVLGHSLEEIADITGLSVLAVKAALHRGRSSLRTFALEPVETPGPTLDSSQRALLLAYVDRFNAHDFDAVRDMLAEEVRLEVVARARMRGRKEVQTYFHNYSDRTDWLLAPGLVEGRPAALAVDPARPEGAVLYFVLLGWEGDRLLTVRDFRHARYVVDSAEVVRLG